MKTTLLLSGILLTILSAVQGQNFETVWEKQLSIRVPHLFTDVVESADGTFTVLGSIDVKADSNHDIWILKLDGAGDTLWTRTFAHDGNDTPGRLIEMPDGSLTVAALNGEPDNTLTAWAMNVSPEGNVNWRKQAPSPLAAARTDIAGGEDGTWWWLLNPQSQDGARVVSLIQLGSDGEIITQYTYSDKKPMQGNAVRMLPDGTLALAGEEITDKGGSTLWVMRINAAGEKIWKSSLPVTGKTIRPECICCTTDNAMLVAGWIGSCMNPDAPPEDRIFDFDLVISKIDAAGKFIWTHNYDREGSEGGNALAVLPDGNILVAGKCETSFTGSVGPWLLVTDKAGRKIKDNVDKFRFGGDQASRIINTSDGGFIMVGPGRIDPLMRRSSGWIKKYRIVQ